MFIISCSQEALALDFLVVSQISVQEHCIIIVSNIRVIDPSAHMLPSNVSIRLPSLFPRDYLDCIECYGCDWSCALNRNNGQPYTLTKQINYCIPVTTTSRSTLNQRVPLGILILCCQFRLKNIAKINLLLESPRSPSPSFDDASRPPKVPLVAERRMVSGSLFEHTHKMCSNFYFNIQLRRLSVSKIWIYISSPTFQILKFNSAAYPYLSRSTESDALLPPRRSSLMKVCVNMFFNKVKRWFDIFLSYFFMIRLLWFDLVIYMPFTNNSSTLIYLFSILLQKHISFAYILKSCIDIYQIMKVSKRLRLVALRSVFINF